MPAREIELLHEAPKSWTNVEMEPGMNPLRALSGDLSDIEAEIDPGTSSEAGFRIRGRKVSITTKGKERRLINGEQSVGIPMGSGGIKLRILVDRASVGVFANDGEWVMPCCFVPKPEDRSLGPFVEGGKACVLSLRIHPVRSIWT